MNDLLEGTLVLARSLSSEFDGMASVEMKYNPYESRWEATANWSNGIHFHRSSYDAEEAIKDLATHLAQFIQTRKE